MRKPLGNFSLEDVQNASHLTDDSTSGKKNPVQPAAKQENNILELDLFGGDNTQQLSVKPQGNTQAGDFNLLELDGPSHQIQPKKQTQDLDLLTGLGENHAESGDLMNFNLGQSYATNGDDFGMDLLGNHNPGVSSQTNSTQKQTHSMELDLLGGSSTSTPQYDLPQKQPSNNFDDLDILGSNILSPQNHGSKGTPSRKVLEFVAMDDGMVLIRFVCTKVDSSESRHRVMSFISISLQETRLQRLFQTSK